MWASVIAVLQLFSHVRLFATPMDCSIPGLSVPHHLPKFAQVHVYCIIDANLPSHPLMPSFPSVLNLSQHQGLFQWVCSLYQEPKVLASASVLPMSIHGWFPFKTDWFDLLVVQETLRSLLQHHSLKASILQHSTFITVQLSQPYVTRGVSVYY